jgi:hypothetical protein
MEIWNVSSPSEVKDMEKEMIVLTNRDFEDDKKLWRRLVHKISFEERCRLLDLGNYLKYRKRLFKLAKKYGIELAED